MNTQHYPCTNCGTTDPAGQWWSLRGYFGVSGTFCTRCYDKVAHDPYGKPQDPNGYQAVLTKQGEQR